MTMPTKSQIAKHWLHDHLQPYDKIEQLSDFQRKLALQDWGEPSCWACGKWETTSDCTDPNASLSTIFQSWNGATFLERCHIVPKMLGGSNDCSNLVLLCKHCHKQSPDVKKAKFIQKWIANKKPHGHDLFQALSQINEDAIKYVAQNIEEFQDYFLENAGQHGGGISETTKAFLIECFYEEKK
jgi:5-methylcytosine-specific restriction endonuclease McrA